MSDSFIKLPSKLLFNPEISSLELRLLGVLMFHAAMNKTEPGHIKYGAEKLGQQIGVGRESCRKALKKLQNLNFLKIKHRGNLINESYGISNDIELTISDGLKFLENGGSPEKGDLYLNNAGHLPLNNAGHLPKKKADLPKKKADLPKKWADLPLNEAGHIDDRFKINLDLNKPRARGSAPAPAHTREQNEPADVTAGRTIPDGDADAIAENSAKEVQAAAVQAELEDFCLVSAFFEDFPGLEPWVRFSKVGGYFALQPIGNLGKQRLDVESSKVRSWFDLHGAKLIFESATKVLKGQILKGSAA